MRLMCLLACCLFAFAQAIQDATLNAIDIPLKVAQLAHDALPLAAAMAKEGNPNSVTDAGVGAMCLRTAVMGAVLNARINCGDLEDQAKVAEVQASAPNSWPARNLKKADILRAVDEVMAK